MELAYIWKASVGLYPYIRAPFSLPRTPEQALSAGLLPAAIPIPYTLKTGLRGRQKDPSKKRLCVRWIRVRANMGEIVTFQGKGGRGGPGKCD